MEESEWEQFFESNPAPPSLETSKQQLEKFCRQQIGEDRCLYLKCQLICLTAGCRS